jgi:hypothetical protein
MIERNMAIKLLNILKDEFGTRSILRELEFDYIVNYLNEEFVAKIDKNGQVSFKQKLS